MNLRPLFVILFFALMPVTFAYGTQDVPPPEKVKEQVQEEQVQEDDAVEQFEEAPMMLAAGDMGDHYLQMQTQAVDAELGKLKSQFGFDDEWKDKIKAALEKEIEKAAKRIGDEATDATMAFSFNNSIDEKLQKKLLNMVAEDLPDEKLEAFANYKKTEAQFRQLKVDIGIGGVLVFLDNQLCLSQEQFDTIRKQFSENWETTYNDMGGMTAINGLIGGKQILEILGKDVWKGVLSAKQLEVFEALDQNSNLMMAIQMSAMGAEEDGVTSEKIKNLCNEAFELKLAEYESLLGLTEKQLKLLSIAKKGASGKVVKRWTEIMEKVGGNINGIGMNMELMIEAMEPIVSKCTRQPAWQKTLSKVFDEQQMEKINEREMARRDLAMNQLLNYLVLSMTDQSAHLGLDMNQHEEFVELVRGELDSDQVNYMEVIKGLYEIDEAEFKEVLSDEQWEKFRPMWEQQKQMMEQQTEAEDEDGNDEDGNEEDDADDN